MMLSKNESRQKIIYNFHKNVLGKYPDQSELKFSHKGKLGHWLETRLGGEIDADGNADLDGYECKIESEKITWGDWSANYRIFCDPTYNIFNNNKDIKENMWILCKTLGVKRYHPEKGFYYSLSGKHMPEYLDEATSLGLMLFENNTDISLVYNYSLDEREDKNNQIPQEMQKEDLLIYKWYGKDKNFNSFKEHVLENNPNLKIFWKGSKASVSLEERIRRKFGIYGTVVGLKNKSKEFYGLKFLKSVSLNDWIGFYRHKNIKYDTGLTTKSGKPYNQWRSSKKFMQTLEEEIYIP